MSELNAAPPDPQDVVKEPEHVLEGVRRPSVVITEQAVAFSTAAGVELPRKKPTSRVMAALRKLFLSSSEIPRPPLHHYPPRGGRHGTRNAQAVTEFLIVLDQLLISARRAGADIAVI